MLLFVEGLVLTPDSLVEIRPELSLVVLLRVPSYLPLVPRPEVSLVEAALRLPVSLDETELLSRFVLELLVVLAEDLLREEFREVVLP